MARERISRAAVGFVSLGRAAVTNIRRAVGPPAGLTLLEEPGPTVLFGAAGAVAVAGLLLASRVPGPLAAGPLRLTFCRAWAGSLAAGSAVLVQYGVTAAFVPLA